MTVNRTTLLDLPLPVTGTESGTWGDTTNNGLTQYVDIAIAGMSNLTSANFTAGALTIETTEGDSSATNISATSAQYAGFRVTSLAANSTITVGNTGTSPARSYRLINADATYSLTFKATGQTGVTLLPGQSALVAFNGTDYVIVGTVGAGSTTDNTVPRFDGTTGKILQSSGITIDDSNNVSGVAQLNITTLDATNIEVTNIKAKDGTAAASIADSTGVISVTANPILSGGTANGVLYLNGSKVATSGSALTFDGTNLGLGVTPSAWTTNFGIKAFDISNGCVYGATNDVNLAYNAFFNGTNFIYKTSTFAARYAQTNGGQHQWFTAPSGTAGNAITFTQAMTLDASGNLGIGTSSPSEKLTVNGNIKLGTSGTAWIYGPSTTGRSIYSNSDSTAYIIAYGSSYGSGLDSRLQFTAGTSNNMWLDSSGNLGLGVTPSAWDSAFKNLQIGGNGYSGSFYSQANGSSQLGLVLNAYYNAGWKYAATASTPASRYQQDSGQHYWYTAPSGTAGNAITFTQAMTLDASGNLIVPYRAVFGQTLSGDSVLQVASAYGGLRIGYNSTNVNYFDGDTQIFRNSAGTTERARITSGGYFKASNSGSYLNSTASYHETVSNVSNDRCLAVVNTNASLAATVAGIQITYTASSPNNTTNNFVYGEDSTAQRFGLRSNGGLANYQSNNVDLSDARTKKDITPAPSYWNKIAALEIVTYKYNDQTHDDINVGVIAQQVEFVEPVWVDADGFGKTPEDGVPLKTVYTKDITFAAIKALQEAMARIETLEAKVSALEGN